MFQSNLTYLILKGDQPLTFFQHLFLIDLIQSMTVFSNPHKEPSFYSAHPYRTSAPHQTLCLAQGMQNQLRILLHLCRI